MVSLNIEKRESQLNGKVFIEKVDKTIIKRLLDLPNNDIKPEEIRKLREYYEKIEDNEFVKMTYKRADYNLGRFFAPQSSLQNLKRKIRHTISQNYYDIDVENSSPETLLQICSNNIEGIKIETKYLKKYVKKRNGILKEIQRKYNTDRDGAKQLFIILMNGGSFNEWKKNNFIGKKLIMKKGGFVEKFMKELKQISNIIYENNKGMRKVMKTTKKGSIISVFLHEYENRVLECMYDFLYHGGFIKDNIVSFCFDGLMVLKNELINEELMKDLSDYVEKETFLKLNFKLKPMDEIIDLEPRECMIDSESEYETDNEEEEVEMITINNKQFEERYLLSGVRSEKDCIEKLLDILDGYFVRCNGDLWVYNDMNGLWYNNQNNLIFQYFYRFDDYFHIIKENKEGEYLSNTSYGNDDCSIKKAVNFLSNMLKNDEGWYKSVEHSSIRKLLFNDGIYDFETKIFTKGFDKDIVFFNKIDYNYEEKVDREIYDYLKECYFRNPFKREEMGDYYVNCLSRSLAGVGFNTDKSFHILKGLTNSGKGAIINAMRESFGGYIDEINAENLAVNKNGFGGDDEKKLGFLVNCMNKRVVFSNELTSNKVLDEELIKKISGGGDRINARKLYKNSNGYIPAFQLFIALNNIPVFCSVEDPLINRMKIVEYDYSFVDNPTKDYQKQSDKDLKKKMRDIKYKRAFAQIIMDNYTENQKTYDFIEENKKKLVSEMDELSPLIKEEYEITDNELNHITKMDIKIWFDKNRRELMDNNFKKCINKLISMGCIEKKCRNRNHECYNKKVFCFIKVLYGDEENDCMIEDKD